MKLLLNLSPPPPLMVVSLLRSSVPSRVANSTSNTHRKALEEIIARLTQCHKGFMASMTEKTLVLSTRHPSLGSVAPRNQGARDLLTAYRSSRSPLCSMIISLAIEQGIVDSPGAGRRSDCLISDPKAASSAVVEAVLWAERVEHRHGAAQSAQGGSPSGVGLCADGASPSLDQFAPVECPPAGIDGTCPMQLDEECWTNDQSALALRGGGGGCEVLSGGDVKVETCGDGGLSSPAGPPV